MNKLTFFSGLSMMILQVVIILAYILFATYDISTSQVLAGGIFMLFNLASISLMIVGICQKSNQKDLYNPSHSKVKLL